MSAVFIQYNGNIGFYIANEYMQLLFHYIKNEIVEPQYDFVNKEDLVFNLNFHIEGYSGGMLTLSWGRDLTNSTDEQTMLQVLQKVKTTLQGKGSYISVAELQSIPTEDEDFKRLYSRKPFPSSELIKIIDALIQMLQGTWESTNYNMDVNY